MKRILIRSGQSPLDNFSPAEVITRDSIGSNSGNLLYSYGIIKTIMVDENTIVVPDYYRYEKYFVSQKEADEISEKFDCYIIPLADAFRENFIPGLNRLTDFVKKLKIPCFLTGAGIKAPIDADINEPFVFDDDVKKFITAVLEKSAIVGVRGEITSAYLSRLGFKEDSLQMAIGCPSMYINGRDLKVRELNLKNDSKICVNNTYYTTDNVKKFMTRVMNEFPNYYYIPQLTRELKATYLGSPYKNTNEENFPTQMYHPAFYNNRTRFFVNVPTWREFASDAALSIGPRLHGNVVPTIAGTPSLIIPKDSRMKELTTYHNFAHIMATEINDNKNPIDIIEKADFQSVVRSHGANFDRYIGFMEKNGIDHIYNNQYENNLYPLDKKITKLDLVQGVDVITGHSLEDMIERWNNYFPLEESAYEKLKASKTKIIKIKEPEDKFANIVKKRVKRKLKKLTNR
ncbi:MAG: polysaccharide pyruvyl transferase family protein [Anaerovoracaceae bacterium]